MSLVVADQLSLYYGSRAILRDASFRIGEGDRIGLIGPNGTGKSSLMRLLAERQSIDGGTVTRLKGLTVGYLEQDVLEAGSGGLLESVLHSIPGREGLGQRIEDLEEALDATDDPDEQTEVGCRLAELHHDLYEFETRYSEAAARRILTGLGFLPADLERPLDEFSGGWRMRAALAALLFLGPDLLLLDEPTNHLDLPTVRWLADFLRSVPYALVLVSHDRDFLDHQIDRVFSFEPEGLRIYKGNFTSYQVQREEEERVRGASARNQDRERKRLERFVERSRSRADKAKLVQSRVKKLERLDEDRIELRENVARMRVRFPPAERAGNIVLRTDKLTKAFGELTLYRDLDVLVPRGERIAVVGVNGAGKTTLLRMLAGELEPDSGEVLPGANVKISYYAQHLSDTLRRKSTVLDEVASIVPNMAQSTVRGILGAFLFRGDDVEKAIGVLSGGERARVALARILVNPGNVLLLDEPTNHLDTESAEILADSLADYGGTIVFVSHNLSFAKRLASQVWDVEHGKITVFPGDLAEYLSRADENATDPEAAPATKQKNKNKSKKAQKKLSKSKSTSASPEKAAPQKQSTPAERKQAKRAEAATRQVRSASLKPLKRKCADLEERIGQLEKTQGELETQLADPAVYGDGERFPGLLKDFEANRTKLKELYTRWESAQEELARGEAIEI